MVFIREVIQLYLFQEVWQTLPLQGSQDQEWHFIRFPDTNISHNCVDTPVRLKLRSVAEHNRNAPEVI